MNRKVIVVGGGVSGVSSAYLIKKYTQNDILLIEKETIGGKAKSINKNGYLIEVGPNGFLDSKEEIKKLISESGAENEVIESNETARKRFIFSNNKLWEFKNNPLNFMVSNFFSVKGRLKILREPFVKPIFNDETVENFVKRRLGQEMLNKLIGPMVCGVFAGNPSYMSMESNFPKIKEIEKKYGSLIKGLVKLIKQKKATASSTSGEFSAKLMSFKRGVGSFVRYLSKNLNIEYDEILQLQKTNKGYILIGRNKAYKSDIVVFAIPSYALKKILYGYNKEFSRQLEKIAYAPISVVSLGFNKNKMPDIVNSFGYLFSLDEIIDTIGVLFDSSIFKNRASKDKLLTRLIIGGAIKKESAFKKNLIEIATKELQRSSNIFEPFEFYSTIRHPFAIPQYGLNHKNIILDIKLFEKTNPGIYITGNAFWGISLNDCIKASYNMVEKIKSGP